MVNGRKQITNAALTRKDEKEKLQSSKQAATFNNYFLSLIKNLNYKKGNIEYTPYIYFLIILQLRLDYISTMFDLIMTFGAKPFLIIHTIFLLGVGLPTFMLLVSMARYCRKGYITFWHCIPVLQGMGYTIALWVNTCEIANITLSGLSLLYIKHTIFDAIPWSSCAFKNATKLCTNTTIENSKKIPDSCLTFPALDYFRNVIQKQDPYSSNLGSINSDSAVAVSLIWLVLLSLMVCGFSSFQNKMKKVQMFVFFVWIFAFFPIINLSQQHYQISLEDAKSPWNMKFVLNVLLFVLNQNTVSAMVWIAALNRSFTLPTTDAIVVYGFKVTALSALVVWVPVLLKIVVQHYKTIDIKCLKLSGFDIIFAVMPDIILRYPFLYFTNTLWFLAMLLHGFSSALYTLTATIDSLGDAFPKLRQYRGHACVLICVVCGLINLLYVTRMGLVLMQTWIEYGNLIVSEITVSITILALMFIYSIQRLVDDYHFAFGVPPLKIWIELWKIIPFITLFQIVLIVYNQAVGVKMPYNLVFVRWTIIAALLMILPIFLVMVFKYLKFLKYHMVSDIIRPDANWGYYIESKRNSRDIFNPQIVRYKRNQLKCKHNCLVNSKNLRKLQELNELHVLYFFEIMNKNSTFR